MKTNFLTHFRAPTLVAGSLALSALISLSACNGAAGAGGINATNGSASPTGDGSGASTSLPTGTARAYSTGAMVFAGSGTWSSEVASIESILTSHGVSYKEVTQTDVDAMSVADLEAFGVLIFPGGSGGTEAQSMTAATHANLRTAVQEGGVGYVGFCAGAFIGVAPAPTGGGDVSYGLGIVDGDILSEYIPASSPNAAYVVTADTFADGTTKDILWYGGPITPSTGVIAKYPDGSAAISEMYSGKGFVVLSGPHPTATAAILSALGLTSSDGTHTDVAWSLINAALTQQPLSAF